MHFRDRGRSVQLVRTTYDADAKKPKTEVLGRLQRPALELDEELKAKLTPEELEEVQTFRGRIGSREAVERSYARVRFVETLEAVTQWLASAEQAEAAAFADEIHKPLAKLRRQLAEGGGFRQPGPAKERGEKKGGRKAKSVVEGSAAP